MQSCKLCVFPESQAKLPAQRLSFLTSSSSGTRAISSWKGWSGLGKGLPKEVVDSPGQEGSKEAAGGGTECSGLAGKVGIGHRMGGLKAELFSIVSDPGGSVTLWPGREAALPQAPPEPPRPRAVGPRVSPQAGGAAGGAAARGRSCLCGGAAAPPGRAGPPLWALLAGLCRPSQSCPRLPSHGARCPSVSAGASVALWPRRELCHRSPGTAASRARGPERFASGAGLQRGSQPARPSRRRCWCGRAEGELPPLRPAALPAIGAAAPSGSPGGHSGMARLSGSSPGSPSAGQALALAGCRVSGTEGAVTALRKGRAERKASERLITLLKERERSLPGHHHGHNRQNLGIFITFIAKKIRAG